MFDWTLFFIIVAITVPGIVVTLPRLTDQLLEMAQKQIKPEQKLPSKKVLTAVSAVQYLMISALFTAMGVYLAPKVGFSAPFFSALAERDFEINLLRQQLENGLLFGAIGGIILVLLYYKLFRPRFDPVTLHASEKLRNELGAAGRLLYGGVFEEVFARWGMMSGFLWLGIRLTGGSSDGMVWLAVFLAGVVFALLHFPSYVAAGSRLTPAYVSFNLVINLWASFICGWLFWQVGLLAAMVAHMMFHLVWLPFDRRHYHQSSSVTAEHSFA